MTRLKAFIGATMALTFSILLLGTTTVAHAQTEGDNSAEIARNWQIRVGMFIFNSAASRAQAGDVGFSGIVERTVYGTDRYDVNVGVGYNGWNTVYSIPITITGVIKQANLRFGGSVGYAFGKRLDGGGTSGALVGLLAGYQFGSTNNSLSVDLRYNFIAGSDNELDGYSITIGTKF